MLIIKRLLLLFLILLFTCGASVEEINTQYKTTFQQIRSSFKSGQITDVEANIQFKILDDKYNTEMFNIGVITPRYRVELEQKQRQIIIQKVKDLTISNDIKIILKYLIDGTTHFSY